MPSGRRIAPAGVALLRLLGLTAVLGLLGCTGGDRQRELSSLTRSNAVSSGPAEPPPLPSTEAEPVPASPPPDPVPPPPPAPTEPEGGAGDLPSVAAQTRALERLVSIGLPVYCGGGKRRYVALTFDDGPGEYTRLALRILRRAEARATFFLVGRNLASHRELLHREEAVGAIGNHSWSHPVLTTLASAAMTDELVRTQRVIARLVDAPVRLFRPPYGAHSPAVDRKAASLGILEVLWNVDSRDSLGADYRGIAQNVLAGLRPGAIILLHENRGQTIRALRYHILPELARRRLRAVSVPELLALDPPSRAQLRRGWSGCR